MSFIVSSLFERASIRYTSQRRRHDDAHDILDFFTLKFRSEGTGGLVAVPAADMAAAICSGVAPIFGNGLAGRPRFRSGRLLDCSFVALPPVALTAEHIAVHCNRLAALRPLRLRDLGRAKELRVARAVR